MTKFLSFLFAAYALLLPADISYARLGENAVLYSYESGNYMPVAVLPETYYVALIGGDADGYTLVSYLDVTGYVKPAAIESVDYVPKVKYADRGFTVSNDSQPANLRRTPHSGSDNIAAVMPSGGGGKIIGMIEGDELISGAGKLWYYVRFQSGDTLTYGYVYSAHAKADSLPVNDGEREETGNGGTEYNRGQPAVELSPIMRVVIVAALCAPLFVAVFMLRPKKRKEVEKES